MQHWARAGHSSTLWSSISVTESGTGLENGELGTTTAAPWISAYIGQSKKRSSVTVPVEAGIGGRMGDPGAAFKSPDSPIRPSSSSAIVPVFARPARLPIARLGRHRVAWSDALRLENSALRPQTTPLQAI